VKILVGVLVAAVLSLVGLPFGLVILLAGVAAPAAEASLCVAPLPDVAADAAGTPSVPAPGSPRLASLNNPPVAIPDAVGALYVAAATRYALPWTLLAGIGMEETNHGQNDAASSSGAQGLMQFLPSTWASYGIDGDGDGRADIGNDADSVHSAAHYLVALGARNGPQSMIDALHVYNPNSWYANDVLYYAAAYAGEDVASIACVTEDASAVGGQPLTGTGPAIDAVNAALRWVGTRYSWGGGSASGPSTGICCSPGGQDARTVVGFDCSGLVLYAYAQIGIALPHLAHAITYNSGGQVIARDLTAMKPGDVIGFSYSPGGRVFHVGLYLGDGRMVNSDSHGVSLATLTSGYYSRLAWRVVRFVA
jgi:hypothetical protein